MPELPEFEDEAVVTEARGVGSSLPPARRLRPPARRTRPHLAVPLRAPEPRLRGLPRLLRDLPAGLPGHHGPDDRQDGLGHRPARPAPGRGAQATRPPRGRARRGRSRRGRRRRGGAPGRSRRERGRGAVAGRLRRDEGPVVLLLERERPLPPPPLLDRRHAAADRRHRRVHPPPRGRRGHLPPVRRRARGARADHRASTARCSPTTRAQAFDESLALARTVFPFIEDHNFYVEHRYFTLFWNKVREFGALLARTRVPRPTRRTSSTCATTRCAQALEELRTHWSSAAPERPAAPRYWPPIVERRKVDPRGDARVGPASGPRSGSGGDHRSDRRSCSGGSPASASRSGSRPPDDAERRAR